MRATGVAFGTVVVFADSPADPNFIRQMELLARSYPELEERDVVLVPDTDPEARSAVRQRWPTWRSSSSATSLPSVSLIEEKRLSSSASTTRSIH